MEPTDHAPSSSGAISLIPLATGETQRAVTEAMRRVGVKARAIPAADLTKDRQVATRAPLVLLLGDAPEPADATLDWLRTNGAPSCMGIVADGCQAWQDEIAERCCDLCFWPTSDRELAMRLSRLHRRAPGRGAADDCEDLMSINFVGRSPQFRTLVSLIRKFARCDAPVLIQGETGTGKELAARAVHYLSERRGKPFVPVNCGALPDGLIENELFGHRRGAFTDARSDTNGLIDEAGGGTLFLDEIDALPARAQVTLLRLLQEREYRPLGGGRARPATARIVAASNSPLRDLVKAGSFRADLFYRLDILLLTIPPLRERLADLPLLVEHFLQTLRVRYGAAERYMDTADLARLAGYDWPGNVRELENCLHRGFLMADDARVVPALPDGEGPGSLDPATVTDPARFDGVPFATAKALSVAEFEQAYIKRLLTETGGNTAEAARRAGKERRALGKLIKKHRINRLDFV